MDAVLFVRIRYGLLKVIGDILPWTTITKQANYVLFCAINVIPA